MGTAFYVIVVLALIAAGVFAFPDMLDALIDAKEKWRELRGKD